jgi:hypothetical protein
MCQQPACLGSLLSLFLHLPVQLLDPLLQPHYPFLVQSSSFATHRLHSVIKRVCRAWDVV